jgi:hypothetical protein
VPTLVAAFVSLFIASRVTVIDSQRARVDGLTADAGPGPGLDPHSNGDEPGSNGAGS